MTRIVIFANGKLNNPAAVKSHLLPTDYIICANGGTQHALALGLRPQDIVGDFDSLTSEQLADLEAKDVTLHRYPAAKDQTDLELALQLAATKQPSEVLLFTALGGRLDQMLGNIMLLTRPDYAAMRITIREGHQTARLLRGPQDLTLTGQPGDTLSLIPLTAQLTGLTLKQVAWPLDQATVSRGSTLTISNQLATNQAWIQLEAGLALVIHLPPD